jgi:hypothetical protein
MLTAATVSDIDAASPSNIDAKKTNVRSKKVYKIAVESFL